MSNPPTLTATLESMSKLASAASEQIRAEDGADRLCCLTLTELEAFKTSVDDAIKKLDAEGTFFSGAADLSAVETGLLESLLCEIREASRKVAIVLAGGKLAAPTTSELADLEAHCDSAILQSVAVEELMAAIRAIKEPSPVPCKGLYCPSNMANGLVASHTAEWQDMCAVCGSSHGHLNPADYMIREVPCPSGGTKESGMCMVYGSKWPSRCSSCGGNHGASAPIPPLPPAKPLPPGPTMCIDNLSETKGSTGGESLEKLKAICSTLASELGRLQTAREEDAANKEQKEKVAAALLASVESALVPGLKKHLLRDRVGKGRVSAEQLANLFHASEAGLIEGVLHCGCDADTSSCDRFTSALS